MFGIFAKSFMTAARTETRKDWPTRNELPKLGWLHEDMPYGGRAGTRRANHD